MVQFLPPRYDYHRSIPLLSIGRRDGITSTSQEEDENPCAICYVELDLNDRYSVMVCPCDHIYHTTCLTRWMEQKMECPTCRSALPPV